ncbi:MAG: class I SAM-dependent rRNA methyltransferase [Desulfatibacillaceae bacterium]
MSSIPDYPTVVLKPGKADSAYWRHPWIFSGAVGRVPDTVQDGDLVRVQDHKGQILGCGTWSGRSGISVRLFTFADETVGPVWIAERIRRAHDHRLVMGYGPGSTTTGYRVVHAEADDLPGLVVDRYADVVVCQISNVGMEGMRTWVLDALEDLFEPTAVVERSDVSARREDGLPPVTGLLSGQGTGLAGFMESGLHFVADTTGGQKTGFFLDQKDLRSCLARYARGRGILNLFSYTGAASVYALAAGAESVLNVDGSESALALCAEHVSMNGLDPGRSVNERADVFEWLGAGPTDRWDMVLMDPPAIIKSRKDAESGRRAYHFLNRAAMRLVKPDGVFVTSSCSQFFTAENLDHVLRRASIQNSRVIRPLNRVGQSPDHPVSPYFPESEYLKSVVAVVE